MDISLLKEKSLMDLREIAKMAVSSLSPNTVRVNFSTCCMSSTGKRGLSSSCRIYLKKMITSMNTACMRIYAAMRMPIRISMR